MKEKPTKAKKKGRTIRAFKRDISLWLFCVPGVILTFIFSYIPMYGVQIAFRRFNATAGITKSPQRRKSLRDFPLRLLVEGSAPKPL